MAISSIEHLSGIGARLLRLAQTHAHVQAQTMTALPAAWADLLADPLQQIAAQLESALPLVSAAPSAPDTVERGAQSGEAQSGGAVERGSGGAVERGSGGAGERWSGGAQSIGAFERESGRAQSIGAFERESGRALERSSIGAVERGSGEAVERGSGRAFERSSGEAFEHSSVPAFERSSVPGLERGSASRSDRFALLAQTASRSDRFALRPLSAQTAQTALRSDPASDTPDLPDTQSAPISPAPALRLAPGMERLATLLRLPPVADVADAEPATALPLPATATPGPQVARRESLLASEPLNHADPPPLPDTALTTEHILEELTRQLELEFIRFYGTSGR